MPSASAQYFRLLVAGKLSSGAGIDAEGYFQSVDVVADSPEEGLSFLLEIDPIEGAEVRIDESSALEARPGGFKGVYATKGRTYYKEAP